MKPGLIVLVVLLAACSQDRKSNEPWVNICPDLTWLDSFKSSKEKVEIYLSRYKGERVFEINPCVGCPDAMTTVHDCAGNILCSIGGIAALNTCPNYDFNLDERLLYWKN